MMDKVPCCVFSFLNRGPLRATSDAGRKIGPGIYVAVVFGRFSNCIGEFAFTSFAFIISTFVVLRRMVEITVAKTMNDPK